MTIQQTTVPPYRPLHKVIALIALIASVTLAFETLIYALLIFSEKGVFNPHTSTEMHINMLEGHAMPGAEPESIPIPGDPGGFAEPSTTYLVHGVEPLQLTTAYLAIAEGAQITLMLAIIILLAIGAIRVLANKPNTSFARVSLLVLGALSIVVSILAPFFTKQTGQTTLQELGIEAETANTVIVAEFFDFQDINFLQLALGIVLIYVSSFIPRKTEVPPTAEVAAG
ncbi:hypothetical protein [Micrococcoides hystricis]|uniref:DUF2975 domain-containing protein n=1 Tax=Micrococcoides hystricis TaxID=1572761 RepID=A0ABV6PCS8_9MICC